MKFRPKINEQRDRHSDEQQDQHAAAVAQDRSRGCRQGQHGVEHGGVQVLAEVRQRQGLEVGVAGLALEAPVELLSVPGGAAPHCGSHETPDGHESQEGLVHGASMLMKPCDAEGSESVTEPCHFSHHLGGFRAGSGP